MFCGGGGSSFGAQKAGAEIVGGIDSWSFATEVFTVNFPRANVFEGQVEDHDPHMIAKLVGPIDLLLASPECTNHSCARGNRPREDKSRDMAFQVIRYAHAMKPRWLVIENVVQMRSWKRYASLLRSILAEGYKVVEHVLDASDFGVPQRRKRLFIICERGAYPPERISRKPGRKPTAASILDKSGVWRNSLLDNGRRAASTLEKANRAVNRLGKNEPFLIVYYGGDGTGWQSLNVPLRTITTHDRFALCEPSVDGLTIRMLQEPELVRGMGFGQHILLGKGTRKDRITILGNGVCPPVMSAIVKELVDV